VEAMRGLSKGGKEGIGRQETRVQSGFRVERNGEIRRGEDRTEQPRFKERGKSEILQVVLGFWEVSDLW
jgi:hypothetical protein